MRSSLLALGFSALLCIASAASRAEDAYRTPREGESFTGEIFGREVYAPSRDLRRVVAVDLGFAALIPGTGGIPVVPLGAVFVFWRPDENRFADAVVAGIFNDVLVAWSPERWGHFELVGSFGSSTIPAGQSEIVLGEQRKQAQLEYGYVRIGAGFGYRKQVGLTIEDMMAINLLIEPGYRYYNRGSDTAANFVVPLDTSDLVFRMRFRFDHFDRNLLSLIHSGYGFGSEAVYGHRSKTNDWGIDGLQDGAEAANYGLVTGYLVGATGIPFAHSERHRFVGTIFFGGGIDVDRFSAPRLGGGPDTSQYRAIRKPVIPGAGLGEFYPSNYVVMVAEYRYELAFFTFLGIQSSLSNLSANAESMPVVPSGRQWLSSIGTRLTTGFFLRTRLRFDYNYNFNVIRDGSRGGSEVVFELSREFGADGTP